MIWQALGELFDILIGFIGMLGLLLWAIFILDAFSILHVWERL